MAGFALNGAWSPGGMGPDNGKSKIYVSSLQAVGVVNREVGGLEFERHLVIPEFRPKAIQPP